MTQVEAWLRAHDVAYVDDGVRVVCLDLSAPGRGVRPLMLEGLSAAVWRGLSLRGSTPADLRERLGEVSPTGNLEACLEALSHYGLISRGNDSSIQRG